MSMSNSQADKVNLVMRFSTPVQNNILAWMYWNFIEILELPRVKFGC